MNVFVNLNEITLSTFVYFRCLALACSYQDYMTSFCIHGNPRNNVSVFFFFFLEMGICDFDDSIRTALVKCERLGQLTHFVPRVLSLPPSGGRERTLAAQKHL